MLTDEQLRIQDGRSSAVGIHGQLAICRLEELRPHSSYVRHRLTVAASKLSALAELGDLAFQEPIVITRARTVVDGYARWELARLQGRPTLPCIEYELTEDEALHCLLQRHRRLNGLNDFCRILLALELEPGLRKRARANQRVGGQTKGSSILTEAKNVNVRSEIARAAGVSAGNVTKVKQLMMTAHPELIEALRHGEIRIHRTWLWSKLPREQQLETLRLHQSDRGIKKTIRHLLSRHQSKGVPPLPDAASVLEGLSALESTQLQSITVRVVKGNSKAIYVTEELAQSIWAQQALMST